MRRCMPAARGRRRGGIPRRRPTGPDAAPGLPPHPAPPQPNRSAHARGRDELRDTAPRGLRTAPNLPITARQRGRACRPGYTNPSHSDRPRSTGAPPGLPALQGRRRIAPLCPASGGATRRSARSQRTRPGTCRAKSGGLDARACAAPRICRPEGGSPTQTTAPVASLRRNQGVGPDQMAAAFCTRYAAVQPIRTLYRQADAPQSRLGIG